MSNDGLINFSNHHFANQITGIHILKASKADNPNVSKNIEGINAKSLHNISCFNLSFSHRQK
jgi:hypothetical protein